MSRGEQLWNAPITQGTSALRNAGASLMNNQRTQQQAQALAQTQYQQPSELYHPNEYEEPVDHDIYNKAISVSSPRLAGVEGEEHPGMVRKKVVRRVEVPFTRTVKVPTQTTQLVPALVEQRVPVKKLVAVPGYKLVDEEYTEYEEREAVREKEIWVKKIVPEKYIEKVPIQRVRQVQKPTTIIKEVESYETVQVPTTKKVLVDGYRVDQVQDSKVVEVEEYQDYELRPEPIGPPQINATRDLGRLPNSRLSRNIGAQVFDPQHPSIRDVDTDEQVDTSVPFNTASHSLRGTAPLSATQVNVTNNYYNGSGNPNSNPNAGTQRPAVTNSFYRPSSPSSKNLNIHGTSSLAASQQDYGRFQGTSSGALNDPRGMPAAGAYRKPATSSKGQDEEHASNDVASLGLTLDDTHTRHTDGTGVLVTKVTRGAAAARAGLQPHDIVTSVNGVPSSTVDEFSTLLNRIQGPLSLTINRDGRRNITLSLYR